jgi:hypothetical protein
MKHFLSLCLLTLAFTPFGYAQNKDVLVNPESINPTTRLLSYKIPAKDIAISSYGGAHPSHFKMTLCDNCEPIIYQLKKGALLEYYGVAFNISELTQYFVDKDFRQVGLGINRDKDEITRISLNPINKEISATYPEGGPL